MFSNRETINEAGLQIPPRAFGAASSRGIAMALRRAAQVSGVPGGWAKQRKSIAAFVQRFRATPSVAAYEEQRLRLVSATEQLQAAVDDREEHDWQYGLTSNNDEAITPESLENAHRRAATLNVLVKSLHAAANENRQQLREDFQNESSEFCSTELAALQAQADQILRDLVKSNAEAFNALAQIGDRLHVMLQPGAVPSFDTVVPAVPVMVPPRSAFVPPQEPMRIDAGPRAAFPAIMG